jgi:hypothetical protein
MAAFLHQPLMGDPPFDQATQAGKSLLILREERAAGSCCPSFGLNLIEKFLRALAVEGAVRGPRSCRVRPNIGLVGGNRFIDPKRAATLVRGKTQPTSP